MVVERRRGLLAALPLVAALVLALLGPAPAAAQAGSDLVGTFRITAGQCESTATGSYFRMILPTGTTQSGPWVDNGDSACTDDTYTPLTPGTDGGLVTGAYQPAPTPGFDADGNSLATRVFRPVRFFGVNFAGSTNPTDVQTGQQAPAPSLRAEGGRLSGDLSAFAATWNDQAFNQGSPKPGGGRPGNTTPVSGTYDAATGRFSVSWTSQIVGGPFHNFTGFWHLEGTFVPAGAAAPPAGGGGAAGPAPAAGAATSTTAAATAAAGAPAASSDQEAAGEETAAIAPAGSRVEDDGFEAPAWLVVLLAVAGIGGVVTLLVLPPRRRSAT